MLKKNLFILFVLGMLVNSIKFTQINALTKPLDSNEEFEELVSESTLEQNNNFSKSLREGIPVFEGLQAAFVVDGMNGQILFNQGANEAIDVGSFSQLLLLYLVYQAVDQGQLAFDQEVWISDQAYQLSQDYNIQNVPLRQDLPYPLSDLIEAVTLSSARGAALALAEVLAGSESQALEQMNRQLQAWGIEDEVNLVNVTGVSDRYRPNEADTINQGQSNRMSAQAVATVAYHLISGYPECLEASQIYKKLFQEDTSDAFEMTNPNLLIEQADSLYALDNVDGLSASRTGQDNFNLIATIEKQGLRLIVVALGANNNEDLYRISKDIIEYGQNAYRVETVIEKNSPASHIDAIKVENGTKNQLQLVYGEDLQLVVPIIDTAPRLVYSFEANQMVKDYQVEAPIAEGTVVGKMQVDIAQYQLPILTSGKGNFVEVKVAQDIEEANFFQRTLRMIQKTLFNGWNAIRKFFIDLFN